jgi:glycosyltransferase involved in cell wall biosynthesis
VRLLVTTTLSPNQLRAHLGPILALEQVEEVILVTDDPPAALPKLSAVVPGRQARRWLGRAGSKLVDSARLARRIRPDWTLSYNIMPHGVNGLVAGRLAGSRTMYHMIGGETEWVGGGWGSENAVLGRLPRPSATIERALLHVIRRADVVGTMGSRARARLVAAGIDPDRVIVTPPAIDVDRFRPATDGSFRYDLLTVGRLVDAKRLEDFVAVVAQVRSSRPDSRAAIAGAGPLELHLRAEASRLGVADAIDFLGLRDDVEEVYRMARVFVLTSAFEGVSVALGEALSSGLPAVVTDVGDLADLVHEGRNGSLRPVGDTSGIAAAVEALLEDQQLYRRASGAAREVAASRSVPRIAELYERILFASDAGSGGS